MNKLYLPGVTEQVRQQTALMALLQKWYGFPVDRKVLDRAIDLYKIDTARKRVMVAIPMYKHITPDFVEGIARMQLDFNHVRTIQNLFIPIARTRLAQKAIDENYEYIFWLDDDMVLPPNTIPKLLSFQKDIVTALYHQKGGEYLPNIYVYKGYNNKTGWYDYNNIVLWEEDTLVEVEGCGFGTMLTKTDVFRNIKKPWFRDVGGGEDFYFCRKALKAGYKIYCDTSLQAGHLTVTGITTRHFYANKLAVKFKDEGEEEIQNVADLISAKAREIEEEKYAIPTSA